MAKDTENNRLVSYEPGDRLVVLARTLKNPSGESITDHANLNNDWTGETCFGKSLYRHRSIFQDTSNAPIWNHFELTYFNAIVPMDAIQDAIYAHMRDDSDLLRAEILLTTPSSFHLPRDWQGMSEKPEYIASLEFLHVQPKFLGEYRNAMREYCGLAAAKLVSSGRFGTFRAMETAAILYQSPEFCIDWNQVHLCELDPTDFESFGTEFKAAMQADLPRGAEFKDTFSDLGRLRTIPRWTFNDPVYERDLGLVANAVS